MNRFESRVVFSGFVHTKVGARLQHHCEGRRKSPDLYVLKDLSGMPYISGSNFKNFLRRQIESLLFETLGPGFCCDSFNRDKACIRLGDPKQDGGIYLQNLMEECGEDDEALFQLIEKHTCICCRLFGSQLVESQIVCEDLKPSAWISQFKTRKKRELSTEDNVEKEEQNIPDKFMIRVALNNCEPWKRGLFIMGLSRAQNKLVTLSTGHSGEQLIATIDGLNIRSLESARTLYEKLSKLEATDGNEVGKDQLQQWIASLRDYLKLVVSYAKAS